MQLVDNLNALVTNFTASQVLKKDEIFTQMRSVANDTLLTKCFSDLIGLQLDDASVPQKFNEAVQNTQVQESQIISAQNKKASTQVELESTSNNAKELTKVRIN